MIQPLQERAGLAVARFRYRGAPPVVSFGRSFSEATNVLVALPDNRADEAAAQGVLRMLRDRVGEAHLTVVASHQAVETARLLPHAGYIPLFDRDVNALRLPRPQVLRKLEARRYDLAVDLCLDFVLPPAYIVRASGARVRVGFAKRGAGVFYNLLVHADPAQGRAARYDRLAECLAMF
jgi:ADP-heptose:LPS heptosyltransferase